MTWRDVIIGKGETGCSSIKVFDLPDCDHHHVSHNQVSFWVSSCILGLGCTIFKCTPEGKKLAKMITEKHEPEEIYEWLDALIIRHVSSKTLHARINQSLEDAFNAGKRSAKNELLYWLHK